jgi:hypothetical protein
MYPKKRIPLPDKYQKIYQDAYKKNRDGIGIANYLSQKMESWGHKIIEKNYINSSDFKTLEIGAGNLNHLNYVKNDFIYDVVEPNMFFYENSKYLKRVNKIFSSLKEIKTEEKYDRVITIMVLEHVLDLPEFLKNVKNVLSKNGCFQAAIPCQGEFAFYLGWRLTTGVSFFLKHGLDWGVIMNYEHVNSLDEIVRETRKVFKHIKIKRSPLPFFLRTKHTSFYAYIEAHE